MTASPEAINPLGVTLDELADNFSFLEDWEDRYSYIIDLGKKLPEMPEALKTEETKVRGCMSQVWIFPVIEQGPPTKVSFMADSDAMLVKGLIAVMMIMFAGKTPDEIAALDADAKLKELDLEGHISPNRRNGVASMIQRIKALADNAS